MSTRLLAPVLVSEPEPLITPPKVSTDPVFANVPPPVPSEMVLLRLTFADVDCSTPPLLSEIAPEPILLDALIDMPPVPLMFNPQVPVLVPDKV